MSMVLPRSGISRAGLFARLDKKPLQNVRGFPFEAQIAWRNFRKHIAECGACESGTAAIEADGLERTPANPDVRVLKSADQCRNYGFSSQTNASEGLSSTAPHISGAVPEPDHEPWYSGNRIRRVCAQIESASRANPRLFIREACPEDWDAFRAYP